MTCLPEPTPASCTTSTRPFSRATTTRSPACSTRTSSSTPRSTAPGPAPQGSSTRFSMFNLFTFKDGKIIEKRAHYNLADIMDQLTAGPTA
ncbi:ester cyclase [Streptomyces sp. ALI-76-A]|nr:ester cyclase [Streptomyces sp. ALI-76-A]MDL5206325.1 ester cyclase [Streptomyces sp. ALI-76-A]